ncbi:MAG: UDP-N-acetylglucosamine diphosphorylase [Puniceicoccaceae bacterium]|nr:MAG: UDP-N-acetylglucosamine diphosphorylase [Puniceicoccaceae bacterium]
MLRASDLFALPPSLDFWADDFTPDLPPWEWVRRIGAALDRKSPPGRRLENPPPGLHVEGRVWLGGENVRLPPAGTLIGPAWIGPGCELRPGVYLRGGVIAGAGCVLGHACEFKNSLLLDQVQVPHFTYVGDSILGNRAHLGAGVICSNLRFDHREVIVRGPEGARNGSGLKKLGALLGDGAEAGCNAVLQPGAVLAPGAVVYPLTPFSGYLPAGHAARPASDGGIAVLPLAARA